MCERFGGPYSPERLMASQDEVFEDGKSGFGLGDVAMAVRMQCISDPLFLASEVLTMPPRPKLLAKPAPQHREAAKAMVDQKNLLLILPRGHLKTTLVDEVGTIWQFLKYPNDRVLFLQASLDNAKALASNVRAHLTSNRAFRLLFPEYAINTSEEAGQILSFSVPCRTIITRERSLEIGTPDTNLAGRHYDVIAASDLMNEQTTPPPCGSASPDVMAKIIQWYATTDALLDSRLVSPRAHKRVDGTFWSDIDLYKEILRLDTSDKWVKIIAGVKRDDDGNFVPVWDSYDRSMLEDKFNSPTMTPSLWAANYASDPLPESGSMRFLREWFKIRGKDWHDLPPKLDVVITVDPAWTARKPAGTSRSDRSALVVSGVDSRGHLYVLDAVAGRWGPNDLIEKVFEKVAFWNPAWVGFEQDDKGLKAMFMTEMARTKRFLVYRTLKTGTRDKEARAAPIHNMAQHFGIYVGPEHKELMEEFLRFPVGKHDDYVDALAYRAMDLYKPNLVQKAGIRSPMTKAPVTRRPTGEDAVRFLARRRRDMNAKPWTAALRAV